MTRATHTNRLSAETSPYLLQHAHNPVEWYAWNEEALALARAQDKPILLSIGYSACHWCHVMAHESFEDEDTARVMNESFINIKVDREERPDLDKIYQTAHQVLAQRGGGWPLTMFLNPHNLVPYFGGTYFPKYPRYGLPGFVEVLQAVAAFYRERHAEIEQQDRRLTEAVKQMEFPLQVSGELNAALLDVARRQWQQYYDAEHGGFGRAPKFPHPTYVERLLRHWARSRTTGGADQQALAMAETTLVKMADGGIYDQLGGGFYRYSVDEQWMIPHFEKMLYDNGPLLSVYTQAWQATANGLFERIIRETAEWVMREMQAPEGGYYSTLDADTEGMEGHYYVWDQAEIRSALEAEEFSVMARRFGLDREPNFEHNWHLHVYCGLKELSTTFAMPRERILQLVETARQKLLALRAGRVRPARDEKVLAAWNGLMIKGMADAGRVLQREDMLRSACQALDFVRGHLWHDGRLRACYKDGRARFNAYLDDYAFLLDAVLTLLQTQWRDQDLAFAQALAEALLTHFEDTEQGGFYFTSHDHERVMYRPKPYADEALPSGNGVAATALARLGHLLGEPRYLAAAARTLQAAQAMMHQLPYIHGTLLTALEEYLFPPQWIVLRGTGAELTQWHQASQRDYQPSRLVFAIPDNAQDLPPGLAQRRSGRGVVAYVCTGTACSAPLNQWHELETLLAQT